MDEGRWQRAEATASSLSRRTHTETQEHNPAVPRESLALWVDLAHAAMIVRDPQGRILLWNRRAEEVFGWSRDEAVGHVAHTLLQTQYPISREATEAELAEQGRWEGELIQTRRDGTRSVALSRQAAQRDEHGTVTAVFELDLDLTEQKRAENEMREVVARLEDRTAELEAIFASLPDAIYVGNENGITHCNQMALDNLGCHSIEDLQAKTPTLNEKLLNRYADTGERIPPEDEAFARALRGQASVNEVISRNLATGQDIIQRSAANPILRNGQVIHKDLEALRQASRAPQTELATTGSPAAGSTASAASDLNEMEAKLLRLLADSATMQRVATVLGVDVEQVQRLRKELMGRLGLRSRTDIVRFVDQNDIEGS